MEWVVSSFVNDSPIGTDAQEVSIYLSRLFCKSLDDLRCSTSVYNGETLIAQSPSSPRINKIKFYDFKLYFTLNRIDPPLKAEVLIGPNILFTGIPILISLVLSILFTLLIAYAIQQREKALALNDLKNKSEELIKAQTFSNLASQISHDVRSPLAALNMIVGGLNHLPEEKRLLIRNSVQRINDIANNLLEQSRFKKDINLVRDTKSVLISPIIDSLLSEKRAQFHGKGGIKIESDFHDGYGLFSNIDVIEFKRVLSNLINNSIEAFSISGGVVKVNLSRVNDEVQITIIDNGKGIPKSVLKRIGEKGVSFGKDSINSGHGLGVFHAKSTIESFLGKLTIDSVEGIGTTVKINLPLAQPSQWFVKHIALKPNQKIIILDDDVSIHSLWENRFNNIDVKKGEIEIINFTSENELKDWLFKFGDKEINNYIFLIDYEFLGQEKSGIDLIKELNINSISILVTSRYEEKSVLEKCEDLGVKLIPKSMAGVVPILIEEIKYKYDCVLIDDDPLVHQLWTIAAKEFNRNIVNYFSFEEFQRVEKNIDRSSFIYVDAHLSNNIRGEDISDKIFDIGFKNIFIATGYDPDEIRKSPKIKGITGKEPPFAKK